MEILELGFMLAAVLIAYFLSYKAIKQPKMFLMIADFLLLIMSSCDVINDIYTTIFIVLFPIATYFAVKKDNE